MFEQPIFNSRERPMTDLLNQAGASNTLRELLRTYLRFRSSNWTNGGGAVSSAGTDPSYGFFGDGFQLYRSDTDKVSIREGLAFYRDVATLTSAVDGVSGLSDQSEFKPIVLNSDVEFTVPAADTVNPRYDIIEVRVNRQRTNLAGRDVLNLVTGEFVPDSLATTLDWSVDASTAVTTAAASTAALSYRRGTAAASPAVPAVTPGYIAIGYVYVPSDGGGVVTLTDAEVMDYRLQALPAGGLPVTVLVEYVGGSAGGLVPGATRVAAPPGINVAVIDVTAASAAQFKILFVGGPLSLYEVVPVGVAAYPTVPGTNVLTASISDNGFASISASDVTDLADPSVTSPDTLTVGEYSPSVKWQFTVNGQKITAGALNHVVPAGSRLHLTFMLYPKGSL